MFFFCPRERKGEREGERKKELTDEADKHEAATPAATKTIGSSFSPLFMCANTHHVQDAIIRATIYASIYFFIQHMEMPIYRVSLKSCHENKPPKILISLEKCSLGSNLKVNLDCKDQKLIQ